MKTDTRLKTVKDLRELTGVTRKQLYEFDKAGLLKPTKLQNDAGYKLYDDDAIDRLWQILIFIEIDTPLKEIKRIFDSDSYNRNAVIKRQIDELNKKKERLEQMILIAEVLDTTGTEENLFNKMFLQKKDRLVKQLTEWDQSDEYKRYINSVEEIQEEFGKGLEPLIMNLSLTKGAENEEQKQGLALAEIEKFARKYEHGRLLLWLITMSIVGKGNIYVDLSNEYSEEVLQYIGESLVLLMNISIQLTIKDYTANFCKEFNGESEHERKKDYITGLKKEFAKIIPYYTDEDFYEVCKSAFSECFEGELVGFALESLERYYSKV